MMRCDRVRFIFPAQDSRSYRYKLPILNESSFGPEILLLIPRNQEYGIIAVDGGGCAVTVLENPPRCNPKFEK
ncbi:hypothetical protein N7501_001877 [Penicillium viridicatum]|nr:hypothetical protein N7501_001877 [Penicillium viridicatum]